MNALKIAGIGCGSLILIGVAGGIAIWKMAGPIGEKMQAGFNGNAHEMGAFLEKTNGLFHGRFADLPLDSAIHDSARAEYWTPKFAKYESRFGAIRHFDTCWTNGNVKTMYSNFKKENQVVWGEFKCRLSTDSGAAEFQIVGHKYSGMWKISDMKVDEKYIMR